MSEPRPRRWFQIHLSTAVVMLVASSGLMGMQLSSYKVHGPCILYTCFGRPYIAYAYTDPVLDDDGKVLFSNPPEFNPAECFYDGAISLSVLMFAGGLSEFLVRRREARKT